VLACFSSLISPLRGSVLDLRVKFVFRLILCPAAGKDFSDRLLRVSAAGSLSYPTRVPCFLFGLCRPLMKCTAPVFYFAKNFWTLPSLGSHGSAHLQSLCCPLVSRFAGQIQF
jgi:hypothetical protein